MTLSGSFKYLINGALGKVNLQLGTLTAAKLENQRVRNLAERGHFATPAFPLLESFSSFDGKLLIEAYGAHRPDIDRLLTRGNGPNRYDPSNDYFGPADACPAYLIARTFKPRIWFEVGSGNSTRVVRQAIDDGKLPTRLVCVDPDPRIEISAVADEIVQARVETLAPAEITERLGDADILFIDSSHQLKAGGDVLHLLLHVVPRLRPGVIVHIHDVFLPYDYPRDWVEQWAWQEQYLVQTMLQFGCAFDVLWPGYYVSKCRPDIAEKLDFLKRGAGASLWLRVRASEA